MKRKSSREGKAQPKANPAAATAIPFEQVRALIDLLEERGLEEFELERAGLRIRIKRRGGVGPPPVFESAVNPSANPAPPALVDTSSAAGPGEVGVRGEDVHVVKSPIVGTYYATPRPDAPPFVQLGDEVEVGQVLCIIEAMKLMNEIEADVAGEITRIYVENAQPVEYGESLFAIRPITKK